MHIFADEYVQYVMEAYVIQRSEINIYSLSQNSCPTSSLNRENSGIAPKRHKIHNLLNEHYTSMYIM